MLVEELKKRNITKAKEVKQVSKQESCWMDPIKSYLQDEILLASKKEARTIMRKASRYVIIDEKIYRRSFSTPYL